MSIFQGKIAALFRADDLICFGKDLENIDQVINTLRQKQLSLPAECYLLYFMVIDIEKQIKFRNNLVPIRAN